MKTKKAIILILVIFLIMNISKQINDYAVDFISNQKERNDGILIGAEPFSVQKNNNTTILLIHGITSSPKDFKEIALFLSEKNISVETILLPGHGTTPKDLSTKTYQDWTTAIENKIDAIDSKNKFLLGYSMGGSLVLNIAQKTDLDGIITINAPVILANEFTPFIPVINIVQKYHVSKPETIILTTKEERVTYDAIPLNSIMEIQKLIENTDLKKITQPSLIIQTKNDTIVNPVSANLIYNQISSKNKELIWLEVSSHSNPYKDEQEKIFAKISQFIKINSK